MLQAYVRVTVDTVVIIVISFYHGQHIMSEINTMYFNVRLTAILYCL